MNKLKAEGICSFRQFAVVSANNLVLRKNAQIEVTASSCQSDGIIWPAVMWILRRWQCTSKQRINKRSALTYQDLNPQLCSEDFKHSYMVFRFCTLYRILDINIQKCFAIDLSGPVVHLLSHYAALNGHQWVVHLHKVTLAVSLQIEGTEIQLDDVVCIGPYRPAHQSVGWVRVVGKPRRLDEYGLAGRDVHVVLLKCCGIKTRPSNCLQSLLRYI